MASIPFDAIKVGYIEDVAGLLGLPKWEAIQENNVDAFSEDYLRAYNQAIENDESEEDAEEAGREAEREGMDDLFRQWKAAVETVLNGILPNVELEFEEVTGVFYVYPSKKWVDAADQTRLLLNDIGYFTFSSLKEFLDSGPFGLREAVAVHLGNLRQWPNVHEGTTVDQIYSRNFR